MPRVTCQPPRISYTILERPGGHGMSHPGGRGMSFTFPE